MLASQGVTYNAMDPTCTWGFPPLEAHEAPAPMVVQAPAPAVLARGFVPNPALQMPVSVPVLLPTPQFMLSGGAPQGHIMAPHGLGLQAGGGMMPFDMVTTPPPGNHVPEGGQGVWGGHGGDAPGRGRGGRGGRGRGRARAAAWRGRGRGR